MLRAVLRHTPATPEAEGAATETIDAYPRAIRRIGARFDGAIGALTEQQSLDHFSYLLDSDSWSAVKRDLHGLVIALRDTHHF